MKKGRKKNPLPPADTGQPVSVHLASLLFVAAATFAAYAGSLRGTWALDDSAIGQFAGIGNVLNMRLGYRKIAYLTFLANGMMDPANPLVYRITNICIHVCNAALVYLLALVTLDLPGWRERYGACRWPVALLSSVIFALHPLNINAVAYIVQRMTSLAALFSLLGLLAYIAATTSRGRAQAMLLYLLAAFSIFLGIFSKENAVMAIPLIALYDFVFLRSEKRRAAQRNMIIATGSALVLAFIIFFPALRTTLLTMASVFSGFNQAISHHGWTATDVYWTPLQHILTEFRVIGRYLFVALAPLPGLLVFDWWGFPVSTGLVSPATTLLSLALVAALLAFAFSVARKMPFISFGILWYLLAISLESFVSVGADLYFEHRNYLPLAGLIFGAVAQAVTAAPALRQRRSLWISAAVIALILGTLTFQRNTVWKDSVTLWKDTVTKAPENLRAFVALGNSYLKESDLESAKRAYEEAIAGGGRQKRTQFLHDALYSLGMTCLFTGDLERAAKVIQVMDRSLEGSEAPAIVKGLYTSLKGDLTGAVAAYSAVLPRATGMDRVIVLTLLGDAYRKQGMPEKALEQYRMAVSGDPSFAAAYYGMGLAYMGMKNLDEAGRYMEKALISDPRNVLALSDMADIMLLRKEPPEKALSFAMRAVAGNPPFYQPYLTMGNVLVVMGNEAEAEGYYKKAREEGVAAYVVPFSRARAYYIRGDRERVAAMLKEISGLKDVPESVKQAVADGLRDL